jgi:hypothetical protein
MTRWTPFTIPAGPKGPRPKDEAVPRLARCIELVEALLDVAEGASPDRRAKLRDALHRTAALEPGALRLVALEALGRRYLP